MPITSDGSTAGAGNWSAGLSNCSTSRVSEPVENDRLSSVSVDEISQSEQSKDDSEDDS
jgi:hypothetical protein